MNRIAYTGLILFLVISPVHSQNKKAFSKAFLEGEHFMMIDRYQDALDKYSELLKQDQENANLHFLIGACYLGLPGEKDKAIPYLEKAILGISAGYREGSPKERGAPREAFFALALAYHSNYQFDKAIEQYKTYKNVTLNKNAGNIEYMNHHIESCERGKSMITSPVDIELLNFGLPVNSFENNTNPVVARNDSTIIYLADNSLYTSIVISQLGREGWSRPQDINRELGADGGCYPTCLSHDGKELYIVKKNLNESDIYISRLEGNNWTQMEALNKNINTTKKETHASISMNGRILLFTSDRSGGQGELDIWKSERSTDGDWEPARNLGTGINSRYNEESPFFAADDRKIYFSSQGHTTMGGYDIFFSELLPNDKWSKPENPGYPISTADDDLFFVPGNNGKRGYLSAIPDSPESGWNIFALRFVQPGDIAILESEEQIEEEVLEEMENLEELEEQEEPGEQIEEIETITVEEIPAPATTGHIIPEPVHSYYTIQIMALKSPRDVSYFKPLTGVIKYSGKDGFHRYVHGEFKSIDEALKKLPAIKAMGYDDAFIMSVQRYKMISE